MPVMPSQTAIQAGADAILDNLGTFNPGRLFDAKLCAAEVYAAMQAVEPVAKSASTFTFKLDTSQLEAQLAEFIATVAEFKAAVEAATVEDDAPNRG